MSEKRLDEFRQVKHEQKEWMSGPTGGYARVTHIFYKVQQKWKAQVGEPYCINDFGPPNSNLDVFLYNTESGAWWAPMKEVWRDLPEVNEAEVEKES